MLKKCEKLANFGSERDNWIVEMGIVFSAALSCEDTHIKK